MEDAIFRSGFENYDSLYKGEINRLKGRNLRVLAFYIFLTLFGKHQIHTTRELYFINGKTIRNNKSCPAYEGKEYVYASDFFRSFHELMTFYTYVSPLKRTERCKVLFQAIKGYHKNRKRYNFASFLDYSFLSRFLEKQKPEHIISRSHYDMLATWLGGLSQKLHFRYSIYQHGIISAAILVPNRFHCDEFFGFDQYSLDVFRNNYISNKDCHYEVYPFVSSVKFENIPRENGKFYIGLIEQNRKDWILDALAALQSEDRFFVIMKHPSSTQDYSGLPENVTVTEKKYGNLDTVVTNNSTMILDYYRSGFPGQIYFTSEEFKDTFADYKSLHCLDFSGIQSRLLNLEKTVEKGET